MARPHFLWTALASRILAIYAVLPLSELFLRSVFAS
jgi:hypothetical protein